MVLGMAKCGEVVTERLDRFQRKHPRAAFPLVVADKYFDDFGAYLGALTYSGFVSLFPLLLLVSTVLGFVLSGDQSLQHEVLTSALHQFPVIGEDSGPAEASWRRPGRPNCLQPRSLLTPFTDNVTLTSGDRRAYSRQAKAQRSKGFPHVDVNFAPSSGSGHDDPSP